MRKVNKMCLLCVVLAIVLLSGNLISCTNTSTTTSNSPGPSKGTLVQTDSIITGEIKAIKSMTIGYPWEIDVLVKSSQDVDTIKNPTSDKVGQVVQFMTDESTKGLIVGQMITAHAKLTGDVEVGTTLYIYSIQ
jgi:hypothetical protein